MWKYDGTESVHPLRSFSPHVVTRKTSYLREARVRSPAVNVGELRRLISQISKEDSTKILKELCSFPYIAIPVRTTVAKAKSSGQTTVDAVGY